MSRTSSLLLSFCSGAALSALSVAAALSTISWEESISQRTLLWNFYLATLLASKGLLPVCIDCELVTLFQVIFYAFLIGVLGYSLCFFGIARLRQSEKNEKAV